MTWLGFCLQALSRQQHVVIASVMHCPPPLQLPIGPIWACSQNQEAGYTVPGQPAIQLRQQAQWLLTQPKQSTELSIPLNPWAGNNTQKHNLEVHLRKLEAKDLSQLLLLDGKLRLGLCCDLDLDSLTLHDGKQHNYPIAAQASTTHDHKACFAPTSAHIAVYGASALAHQVVNMLSDGPFTVIWEGHASECVLINQSANILIREPDKNAAVRLPPNSHCLVMTHDLVSDFEICANLAKEEAVRSVGVVGSQRKCNALRDNLAAQNLNQSQLDKIRCPLGRRKNESLNAAALDIVHEVYSYASTDASPAEPV